MSNKLRDFLIKTIKFLVLVTVIGVPLFYIKQSVLPYTLPKTAFFQGVVEILFFLWLALILIDKRYRLKKNIVLIGLLVFIFVLAVTAFLGEDIFRSFWSTQSRALGVITIFHFAALAAVLSSLAREINWKKVFYASLITSSIISILAFWQIFKPDLLLNEPIGTRPGATFGNPTFLAGYLLPHVFLALYFLFNFFREDNDFFGAINKKSYGVILVSLTLVLNVAGIFRTETRGDILGLMVGLLMILGFFAFRPPRFKVNFFKSRYVYLSVFLLVVFLGFVFLATKSNSFWSKVPGINRFQNVSFSSQELMPRLSAMSSAWEGFKEKPILGWGYENFNLPFNKHYDPKTLEMGYQETRFDKPHNLFLEYLVTGGAVLFLAFIFLVGVLFYGAFKLKDKFLGQIIAVTLTTYLIRSFFVFDTLGPLLIFYLLIGFVGGNLKKVEIQEVNVNHQKLEKSHNNDKGVIMVSSAILVSLILVYVLNINVMRAGYYQYLGFTSFVKSNSKLAIASFKKGIEVWTPYAWDFKRDYAATVAENYFYGHLGVLGDSAKEEVWLAIKAMEETKDEHPKDAFNHYMLIDLYNQVSDLDLALLTSKAEQEAKIALELSPDRQQVYFSLAKTKLIKGEREEALELVRYGLELNPKVPDAHFYYGLLSFDAGDTKTGYDEIKKAIELGRRWRNFNEPRIVANFFADAGYLDEAIEFYKTAVAMSGRDVDSESLAKLAVAYFYRGESDLARNEFLKLMEVVDIKNIIGYEVILPILRDLGLAQ